MFPSLPMFFLNRLRGVAIELEHGGIELQDILGADVGRRCGLGPDDLLEIGRHLGGAPARQTRCQATTAARQHRPS